MKKIFVFFSFFLLFASFSWSGCQISGVQTCGTSSIPCSRYNTCSTSSVFLGFCDKNNGGLAYACVISKPSDFVAVKELGCDGTSFRYQFITCTDTCSLDSASNGGIILECQFDVVKNKWYKYTCTGGNSCADGSCRRDYYNDESLCLEKYCQENPTLPQCRPPCDSTKWECHTYTETTQTTVASDNITCIDGTCWGLTYCEYITRNTTECDNECGTHTEQTNEIPMTYEGACNPDYLDEDNMCSATKCIESNGQYSLYQMCQSRMINNGEIQLLPRMVGGGQGSCKNAGYFPENGTQNDSTGTSPDSLNIPLECFQFGLNCPEPDSSSYTNPDDRTSQNGCTCQSYDGQKYISQIVCPDGSVSVIYSSCDDWKNRPTSSSSDTPESSSSAEQPASSGGQYKDDWTTYSQGEDIKAALAVIAANTAKSGNNQVFVQQNQEYLDQFVYQDDGTEPHLNIPDSMLTYDSTQVDTNGILQSIFGRLDSSNKILDTISTTSGVCPCLTFFSGNQNTSFANGHIQFKELVIDMANFHGFNFCTIISAIVVALASVVSFFIGFSIFKNVSQ